jgi:hypothetical protein
MQVRLSRSRTAADCWLLVMAEEAGKNCAESQAEMEFQKKCDRRCALRDGTPTSLREVKLARETSTPNLIAWVINADRDVAESNRASCEPAHF